MKKIILSLMAAGGAMSAIAQTADTALAPAMPVKKSFTRDSLLKRWVLDINALGGVLMQDITTEAVNQNYLNALNYNSGGDYKFTKGMSFGGDAQIGFFFGRKRHFGLGTGIMYLEQKGDLTASDKFHVEYQSTDGRGDVYRQIISSTANVKEQLRITNLSIPLLLKYKNRFSKHWGFTADAGVLFSVMNRNKYTTDARYDYEAIYKYQRTSDGGLTTVYDNSPSHDPNSLLLTRAEYNRTNPGGDVNAQFNTLNNRGYNVGLGVAPNNNAGTVSYTVGALGFLVQPSINYFFSDNVALNIGAYYMYQATMNDNKTNYRVSEKMGEYSSVLNTVSQSNSQSIGGNLGVRIFFGRLRDTDHDGVPDRDDLCPADSGLLAFRGCPDQDGDGIPDREDSCATVPGIMKFQGCPDSDGDGIMDKDDACPYQPGKIEFRGCPDRDNDGIQDKEDLCPDKPGTREYQGCPDTDGDGVPDNTDRCPEMAGPVDNNGCPYPPKPVMENATPKVSTPILFEVNSTNIQQVSYPVLEEAVRKVNEDKDAVIVVNGYTDVTGTHAYNKALSLRRANAVKAKLVKMGVKAKKIKVVGHGENGPAASNDTPEGRMQNRRAVMNLNIGE